MKKQIIVIHGGDTFDTHEEYLKYLKNYQIDFERYRTQRKDWKTNLQAELGEDFEVILPDMPNKRNAKYLEWKIWFEKFIPYLEAEIVLIGHSLGGTFLAKYLSENDLPKKIRAVFLLAAPNSYDSRSKTNNLEDFTLPNNLNKFNDQAEKIFIYQSKDDPLVPLTDAEKYKAALPKAELLVFENKKHFTQPELPELVNEIKKLYH